MTDDRNHPIYRSIGYFIMQNRSLALATVIALGLGAGTSQAASVILFDQDFEAPSNFQNGAGSGYDDVSQQQVNDLYGNQPSGFAFAQRFTVETLLLTGTEAFGSGYSDPSGRGGNYALGMLSSLQDDRLGLTFDVGNFDFFNFRLDFSSLGISGGFGNGPFADPSIAPSLRVSLFDTPGGLSTIGSGTLLDQAEASGGASPLSVVDYTTSTFVLDASGSTDGNVTLQLDLLDGGYAALDNFVITASDEAGGGLDPAVVPLPAGLPLLVAGLTALGALRFRRRTRSVC